MSPARSGVAVRLSATAKAARRSQGPHRRAAHPHRPEDRHPAALGRRDPQLLGAEARRQDRRDPRPHEPHVAEGRRDRDATRASAPSSAASAMRRCDLHVIVESQEDFDAWLKAAGGGAATGASQPALAVQRRLGQWQLRIPRHAEARDDGRSPARDARGRRHLQGHLELDRDRRPQAHRRAVRRHVVLLLPRRRHRGAAHPHPARAARPGRS